MANLDERFLEALKEKRISPLVLDNKWHKLFDGDVIPSEVENKATELKELLKKQGNANNELKKVKALKKQLLNDMVTLADDASSGAKNAENELAKHKKLVEDCNNHIENFEDELLDYPREIDRVNKELMLITMEYCYERLQKNGKEIDEISKWIDEFRIELKKQVVRKQDREISNHKLYSYMHDIFGSEVIELFDMQYVPNEVKTARQKEEERKNKETNNTDNPDNRG